MNDFFLEEHWSASALNLLAHLKQLLTLERGLVAVRWLEHESLRSNSNSRSMF